jgi:hypothetical protein
VRGGMGIIDLDIQNKCLLSKWVFKLLNEDGVWQQMLRKKYLKGKTLSQVEKQKETRTSGLDYWKLKTWCLKGVGFKCRMDPRLGFGRTSG